MPRKETMTLHLRSLAPAGLVCGLALALALTPASAPGQLPPQGQPPAAPGVDQNTGQEVLARGPVHEAYASTVETPAATPVVQQQPPEAIEELPPDEKPAGDNVQWIPGYWQWDEERTDFIWISGFWRAPPPNRVWVPGSWRQVQGGFQWVSGFWQDT